MPSESARERAMRNQKLAIVERQRKRRRVLRRLGSAVVIAGIVVGLVVLLSSHSQKPPLKSASKTTTTIATTTTTVATTTTTTIAKPKGIVPVCPPASGSAHRVIAFTKAPPLCISSTAVFDATFRTDVGTFVVRMPVASSLLAVNNFVFLARYHFYDGTVFQRVIPNFAVQGGDPTGTGLGGPGYSFTGNTPKAGCAPHCYALGAFAMANSGTTSSDASQFFVVVVSGGEELPPTYTLFGQVTSGMSVVLKIAKDGDAADNGTPPKVLHHLLSVTVAEVAS